MWITGDPVMLSPSGMILAAALAGVTKVLSAPMRAKTMAEVRMNILAYGVWVNRLNVGVWLEDQSGVPRRSYTRISGPERDLALPGLYSHIVACLRGAPRFLGNPGNDIIILEPFTTDTHPISGFHPVDLAL